METTTEYKQLCLINLPLDIFGEIFGFLEDGTDFVQLVKVCKYFHGLLIPYVLIYQILMLNH